MADEDGLSNQGSSKKDQGALAIAKEGINEEMDIESSSSLPVKEHMNDNEIAKTDDNEDIHAETGYATPSDDLEKEINNTSPEVELENRNESEGNRISVHSSDNDTSPDLQRDSSTVDDQKESNSIEISDHNEIVNLTTRESQSSKEETQQEGDEVISESAEISFQQAVDLEKENNPKMDEIQQSQRNDESEMDLEKQGGSNKEETYQDGDGVISESAEVSFQQAVDLEKEKNLKMDEIQQSQRNDESEMDLEKQGGSNKEETYQEGDGVTFESVGITFQGTADLEKEYNHKVDEIQPLQHNEESQMDLEKQVSEIAQEAHGQSSSLEVQDKVEISNNELMEDTSDMDKLKNQSLADTLSQEGLLKSEELQFAKAIATDTSNDYSPQPVDSESNSKIIETELKDEATSDVNSKNRFKEINNHNASFKLEDSEAATVLAGNLLEGQYIQERSTLELEPEIKVVGHEQKSPLRSQNRDEGEEVTPLTGQNHHIKATNVSQNTIPDPLVTNAMYDNTNNDRNIREDNDIDTWDQKVNENIEPNHGERTPLLNNSEGNQKATDSSTCSCCIIL
ncbi:uncharacterized protein TRIADDRAFT_55312 [Trichoplax adhaerens]|uniref:Uncharacterized protein n=1 Tax=Trichoplax adhaerens TaxID=10228 RepID=B3RUJ6_TRIAD|nr:hypothetical protein TRIADDRAFT_55312 [Trichoplax adhaerens]EDV25827.1 hypothetical protein TRIADDRAFT_55312 [Trichoplax adhaerens]|eukprot:XP_002111860.1 hypothetical protein TRIADDRAFT_55312 [Trichoplax adhaerens]